MKLEKIKRSNTISSFNINFMKKIFFLFITIAYLNIAFARQIDTLINLSPVNFSTDFTKYNQKTAVYLAQLSDLAYAKDMKSFNSFINKYIQSYPGILLRSEFLVEKSKNTDTQILLWATRDFVVLSFRGTEITRRNIITDLKYFSYEFSDSVSRQRYFNLPAGHAGFRKAIMNLVDRTDIFGRIETILRQTYPGRNIKQIPVYLTGHSLGGALASMFAEPLTVNKYTVNGLYLFAPALTISCTEKVFMENKFGHFTYNIVNYKDYIPRAGLRGTLAHYGKFYRICNDSTLSNEPERYVEMRLFEKKNVYKYHSLTTYINLLDLSINTDEVVSKRKSDCFFKMNIIHPCARE